MDKINSLKARRQEIPIILKYRKQQCEHMNDSNRSVTQQPIYYLINFAITVLYVQRVVTLTSLEISPLGGFK